MKEIIHGDCIDVMKTMQDKSVDLCITDFPYGINENYNEFEDTPENVRKLINLAMPEILRVSKRALITCGVANIYLYPKYDWCLIWYNKAGCGSSKWGFITWQPILAYGKDPYLENRLGRKHDSIENNETSPKNGHPCPKPLQFWKKLLTRGSVKKTDIIFDPFAGSGTTAIACEELGYENYILAERDKTYIDLINNRIAEYKSQTNLFKKGI